MIERKVRSVKSADGSNVRFAPVLACVYITAVPDSSKLIGLRFLFFSSLQLLQLLQLLA